MSIYPFHKIEKKHQKKYFALAKHSKEVRSDIITDLLEAAKPLIELFHIKQDNKYHIGKVEHDFNLLSQADIYGESAIKISFLLFPIHKNIQLDSITSLAGWKIMNYIWSYIEKLNIQTNDLNNTYQCFLINIEKLYDDKIMINQFEGHSNLFDKYFAWAVRSLARAKVHTATSALIHIVKYTSPIELNEKQQVAFVCLLFIYLKSELFYILDEFS